MNARIDTADWVLVNTSGDTPPFGRLWCGDPDAICNARFYSRSHDAVIRVYDEAGNVIETHEHAGEFKSRSTLVTAGFRWHNSRSQPLPSL
jgi:hypothetical protein